MNGIDYLEWDSKFFNKTIGSMRSSNLSSNPLDIDMEDFDLIYVFSKKKLGVLWDKYFMDKKINIEIDYKATNPIDDSNLFEIHAPQREEELKKLILLNGLRSRFYVDPKLNPMYEKLYLKWGEKCFNFQTNRTWYYVIKDQLAGFFTMDISKKYFAELCTIDPSHQRKGIAEKLLRNGFNEVSKDATANIRISYQGSNLPALKMYEKIGFTPYEEWYIYHLWK